MAWGPIMGAAWNAQVSQWSIGDYTNSTRTEDDLALITSNGFSYRVDDAGNTTGTAAAIAIELNQPTQRVSTAELVLQLSQQGINRLS